MAIQVNKRAIAAALGLIIAFEGYSHYPIIPVPKDPPTVCHGHANAEPRYYSDAECDQITDADLKRVISAISADMPPLPPEILGATADFCYNVGLQKCKASTLYKYLKQGNYLAACNEFPKWELAHGKRYEGLVRRRQAERNLCMKGLIP